MSYINGKYHVVGCVCVECEDKAKAALADAAELQRFREREPLVQALLEDLDETEIAWCPVRLHTTHLELSEFGPCITGGAADAPAAADLAHDASIGATKSLKKASDEP